MPTNKDPKYVTRWRHTTGRCKNYRASSVRNYRAFALYVARRRFSFLKDFSLEDFYQEIEVIVLIAKRRESYDRLGAKRFKNLVNRELYHFARRSGFLRKGGYFIRPEIPTGIAKVGQNVKFRPRIHPSVRAFYYDLTGATCPSRQYTEKEVR